jgi:capsular exopolysaccharide synthesis family protein
MPSRESASLDLHETIRVLRSRKWEILVISALAVGAALAFAVRQTPLYRSTAEVLVEPIQNPLNPYVAPQEPNLDTERQLAQSQAVTSLVQRSKATNLSAQGLIGNLDVSVVAGTDVLSISYSDASPQNAARMANAYADAYLKYRTDQAVSRLNAAASGVSRSIDATFSKLRGVNARIGRLSHAIDAANQAGHTATASSDTDLLGTLTSTRQSLIGQLGALQTEYQTLTPNGAVRQSAGAVVQKAGVPKSPATPNLPRTAVMALVAGLALGIGVAMLRDRLDDRVKGRDELERQVGVPVVAAIPRVAGWHRESVPQLVMVTDPKSPVAEAYRTLATNVQYLASQRQLTLILITSASGGEGKTTTAANLGVALAQTGKRVILVSADMRRPRLNEFFGVQNNKGLSSLLEGTVPLADVAVPAGIRNLRILPSGPIPDNPAGLLGGRIGLEFMNSVPSLADFVLLDAPPTLAVADASILAPRVDGTLYVIGADQSSRSAIQQARSQLENAGATLIGAVYNDFDPARAESYAYYHSYYYAYYGRDEKRQARSRGRASRSLLRRKRAAKAIGFGEAAPNQEGHAGQAQRAAAREASSGGVVAVPISAAAEAGTGNGGNGTRAGLPLWWTPVEPSS